eukprot:scaffold3510_cov118-Isochrysis_galbana.AAC.2
MHGPARGRVPSLGPVDDCERAEEGLDGRERLMVLEHGPARPPASWFLEEEVARVRLGEREPGAVAGRRVGRRRDLDAADKDEHVARLGARVRLG